MERDFRLFFVGIPTIAPLDGQQVIGADVRRVDGNVVARLRHVVESGVVHDRRSRTAHATGERRRAQRIGGIGRGGNHVVAQAERVTHFVAGHEAHGIADEAVGQVKLASRRVVGSRLHLHPLADERLHVVPPDDVGLDDFARARVDGRGSHCVGLLRGHVGKHRAGHVVAFLREAVGEVLHANHVLKPCPLKRRIPIEDASFDVGSQMGRNGLVDIDGDGFHRFHELPAEVGGGVRRFESPSRDVAFRFHALLRVGVLQSRSGEIADALVFLAPRHRMLGQERERGAHLHRHVHLVFVLGHRRGKVRQCCHAVFKRFHRDDAREVALGRHADVDAVEHIVQAVVAPVEQVVHLHDDARRVLRRSLRLQTAQNRVDIVVVDGHSHVVVAVDFGRVALLSDVHALALLVPMEADDLRLVVHALVHARFVQLVRHFLQAIRHEKRASEQRGWNLQINRVALHHHVHHALPRHRVASRQPFVVRHGSRLLHLLLFLLEKRESLCRRGHQQGCQAENQHAKSIEIH